MSSFFCSLTWLARPTRRAALVCLALFGAVAAAPTVRAQTVVGGDFDICDFCGTLSGNTARLTGRVGFGTTRGEFVLINAATSDQDVDRDGFTAGVDFNNLFVSDTLDFQNVSDPSRAILRRNLVVADFLNPLRNGFQNIVAFYVNIPEGTAAGLYRGRITVRDSALAVGQNPNGEAIRVDAFWIEIDVQPSLGLALVEADTAAPLDSLVLRGKAGQTVNGVFRVANLGNVELQNVRFDVTDLVATSGTGLRIRRERISFTPASLTGVEFGDSTRVTITVRIPSGLLAGSYRGDLIVQAEGVPAVRVPLTVIVTTPGDIVFETNPVIGQAGDLAVIIFNADPGSTWELAVFDMLATTTFRTSGTVFEGTPGDPPIPGFEGDQAVRYTWPLVNGRGENVAGGMYYVVINAVQGGEERQLRGKLMIIR
ncbi:MAG TPA: hypothetical protein VJ650_01330 [Gemmatimonadaceae bacterium]|nr:hypothetical protein [Gemmatimonadaceae bacterium]